MDRPALHYLEALNPEQRNAVVHTGNPLLILAGAGSGKTRVITTKIAYLIREQGVDPRSILAVTFTNKAAAEMAERAKLIDERADLAVIRTFHSFGAWFLRRHSGFANLTPGFTVYDENDTRSLLSLIMRNASKTDIAQFARNISRAKDAFLSPDDPNLPLIDYREEFRNVYAQYEERLAQTGNPDFGDLIKKPVEILRTQPETARRFKERFQVILVDEYQDANTAQFELLKELCGPRTYLCAVGDDDQSIYRFRGAEVRNILEFPERFAGTAIIRLERNYRSTAPILRVASSVVSNNRGRLGKNLSAQRTAGKKPVLAFLPNQDEEVFFCARLIALSVRPDRENPASYADWAVLYRTNAQSLGFETEFLRRNIPYRVVGSLKFYERAEVQDALALLALLANPKNEVAFRRVLNKPVRGAGPAVAGRIAAEAAAGDGNLLTAARRLLPSLPAKARSGVEAFLNALKSGQDALTGDPASPAKADNPARGKGDRLNSGEGLSLCAATLIRNTGIDEYHTMQDEAAGNQRISNLQELVNASSLYPASADGLIAFLEHIALDRSLEEAQKTASGETRDAVTLITLHNTKGLEFRRVIMTGVEQGVFPRDEKKGDDLEEERRLFYVGATRAMDELYICSSALRRVYGYAMPMQPSLFLYEMDTRDMQILGAPPNRSFPQSVPTPQEEKISQLWDKGDRLFHEDQGYGSVTGIRNSGEGPIIQVQFDTGKELNFLEKRQNRRITKIGGDPQSMIAVKRSRN
ncbi:MAG: ATP-dependent helicase [Spirochaetaceae bacterium]|nr:ATP-dependent helicase [Spirochaetaceae bacterium]